MTSVGEELKDFDFGEGASRSIKIAKKTFYEVSDKTEYNCQYYAVYRAFNNDYNTESISKQAFDLKNKIMKHTKLRIGGDLSTLQLLADYKQIIIKVYNNIYELTNTINPTLKEDTKRKRKVKTIEIRLADHHWTALFRYRDMPIEDRVNLEPTNGDDDYKKEEDKLGDCEIITTKAIVTEAKDNAIGTYDLETTKDTNGKCICYMAGMCFVLKVDDITNYSNYENMISEGGSNNHSKQKIILLKTN